MEFDKLKNAINNGDIELAASLIVDIYITNPEHFKKTLLLSNSLPEPLGRDFTTEKLNILYRSFLSSGMKLINKGINIEQFHKEFFQIIQAIKIINQNSESNLKRLERNKFSDYSISEQIQMFCIYLEDQNRLANNLALKDNQYITGMESQVAKFKADNFKEITVSTSDNFEALIEIAETLFKLLYYRTGKNIEKTENFIHEGISPYNISSFEEIIYLADQRNLLNLTWGKFKYRDWNLFVEEHENEKINIFEPISKEEFMKESIGINRYYYLNHINLQKEHAKDLESNQKYYKCIEECSGKVDIENIASLFLLKKDEYLKASEFTKTIVKIQLKSIDKIYYNLKLDGIKMEDIIKGIEYLYTIALIYREAALLNFNEDDVMQYRKLSPIFCKKDLINHFKEIYDIDVLTAEKVINNFIFTSRSKLDIFSQPLIYVGKNNVVFCPMLILQMNMVRIIEMLTSKFKVDISDKGMAFETQLRSIFTTSPHIKVNTNKLEFKAYDGRDIEYDFIGMLEDHLLLIEFKHLQLPFSDKEYKRAFDTLKVGVEQVNRRIDVIKNDWGIIKEKCSFPLPEEPIEENKIIKLVCTNIFNFSTLVHDGVEIIDSSSLLKFFIAPEVQGIAIGNKVEEVFKQKLWKNNYPTVTEFKEFLELPIAIAPYMDCYEELYKPILKIEDDDKNIAFFDYNLVKDPYENLYKKMQGSKQTNKNAKIGRNSPCPCESGKKYKKCCGV
ncbi:SEC-C metal-binding domain-containing protein [Bacillus cereus]|nr:SEC-C metal-binding domain-containing protein [Bacillus cereus]